MLHTLLPCCAESQGPSWACVRALLHAALPNPVPMAPCTQATNEAGMPEPERLEAVAEINRLHAACLLKITKAEKKAKKLARGPTAKEKLLQELCFKDKTYRRVKRVPAGVKAARRELREAFGDAAFYTAPSGALADAFVHAAAHRILISSA